MLIPSISAPALTAILRSHGWAYLAPCEVVDGGFRYAMPLGARFAVTITVAGLNGSTRTSIDRALSPSQTDRVRSTVKHMLSLDFPLADFVAMCRSKKSTPLLRLARRGWGRMFRSPTYWEDAVKTLCTTNASWGYGASTPAADRRIANPGFLDRSAPAAQEPAGSVV
jgi:hypothetical protein